MPQTLELENLVTNLVGNDEDYQRMLKHAEDATGITAKEIEDKLQLIQKSLEDLDKGGFEGFEKNFESLIQKVSDFRDELKVDEIHAYADAIEKAGKELPGLQEALGGTKQGDLFKSAKDVKFWNEFSKEASHNTGKWDESIQKVTKSSNEMGLSFKSVFRLVAGATIVTVAHRLGEEILKDITGVTQFNEELKKTEVLMKQINYLQSRDASRRASEIGNMKGGDRLNALEHEQRNARTTLGLSRIDLRSAQEEMKTFEGMGGDKLFNTPQYQAAVKGVEDAQKAVAEARKKFDDATDSIVALKRETVKLATNAMRDLDKQYQDIVEPQNAVTNGFKEQIRVLKEAGVSGARLQGIMERQKNLLEAMRDKFISDQDEGLIARIVGAESGNDISKRQQFEREQKRTELEKNPLGLSPEVIDEQIRKLEEVQKIENEAEKDNFFKKLNRDAENLNKELKGMKPEFIAIDNVLEDMKDKGIFSEEELDRARKIMEENEKMKKQIEINKKRGGPGQHGAEAVLSGSAESFAILSSQRRGATDQGPLNNIDKNTGKTNEILAGIKTNFEDFFSNLTAAGLN